MAVRGALAGFGLLLLVAGCGGDDGGEERASTTSRGPADATTEPSFGGAGSEEFCARTGQAQQELARLSQAASSPEAAPDVYASAAQSLTSLADSAPAEIKADADVVARAYQNLAQALEGAGGDPSRMMSEIARTVSAPDVTAAGQRLNAYQRDVCGTGP